MNKIPYGYCYCNCGQKTNIADRNRLNSKKGEPYRYIRYHWHHSEEEAIEHFWEKVDIRSKKECWLWKAATFTDKTGQNRGHFRYHGKTVRAHRLAYILTFGPIEDSTLEVCHNCPTGDNPLCVNPYHMFLGTHTENMRDMVKKGRANPRDSSGENNNWAKITEKDVLDIRQMRRNGMTYELLAKMYNFHPTGISAICRYKTWKRLP